MKKILTLIKIVIATIALYSCTAEHAIGEPALQATKGMMAVEILVDEAQVDDYIYSARFIVFDNVSTDPTVDVNQMVTFEKNDAKSFRTYLKVRHNPDKTLIVILNEPDALTGTLESVRSPYDLNTIKFQMADIFNQNHTVIGAKGMPMTGTVHGISITESHADENRAFMQSVTVRRAVARVELWFKTLPPFEAQVTENTKVTLSRSHNEGYLIAPDALLGSNIPTIASPGKVVIWQHTGSPLRIGYEASRFCIFYTPERTCNAANNADKLVLNLEGLETAEGKRKAVITLTDFFDHSNIGHTAKEIRRNYVYKTIGNISKERIDFIGHITPWTWVGQNVILDPQYFLTVSEDLLYLPNYRDRVDVIAETNYDRDNDRGYPEGICIGETRYYTRNGEEVTDTTNPLYGWLRVALDADEGYFRRSIEYSNQQELKTEEHNGCFAITEVKAGNLTKQIRISL